MHIFNSKGPAVKTCISSSSEFVPEHFHALAYLSLTIGKEGVLEYFYVEKGAKGETKLRSFLCEMTIYKSCLSIFTLSGLISSKVSLLYSEMNPPARPVPGKCAPDLYQTFMLSTVSQCSEPGSWQGKTSAQKQALNCEDVEGKGRHDNTSLI